MKQSKKGENDTMENPECSPSIGGTSASLSWPNKDGKSIVRHGPASDCTSVSADSPAIRSTQVRSILVKSFHFSDYTDPCNKS